MKRILWILAGALCFGAGWYARYPIQRMLLPLNEPRPIYSNVSGRSIDLPSRRAPSGREIDSAWTLVADSAKSKELRTLYGFHRWSDFVGNALMCLTYRDRHGVWRYVPSPIYIPYYPAGYKNWHCPGDGYPVTADQLIMGHGEGIAFVKKYPYIETYFQEFDAKKKDQLGEINLDEGISP